MKKIVCLTLAVLLCLMAFGLSGCGDNGYTEVQSITYSVGGKTTTLTSNFSIILENEAIGYNEQIPVSKWYESPQDIAVDKSNIKKSELPQSIGETIGIYVSFMIYKNGNFLYIEYKYVLFKKIDEKTIRIKYDDTEIEVMPDSYQVTYFN